MIYYIMKYIYYNEILNNKDKFLSPFDQQFLNILQRNKTCQGLLNKI